MSKYRFPKIDLHLHLDGSMLPESAWEMAAERGIALPADTLEAFREFIVVTADCRSVNEYLKRFEMPLQILQDKAALERTAYELVRLLGLTGLSAKEVLDDPVTLARRYAGTWGCTVLLKGAATVVSDGKRTCIVAEGNAGLGKGGSGDVLTGIITGLLSQGVEPYHGACLGRMVIVSPEKGSVFWMVSTSAARSIP